MGILKKQIKTDKTDKTNKNRGRGVHVDAVGMQGDAMGMQDDAAGPSQQQPRQTIADQGRPWQTMPM